LPTEAYEWENYNEKTGKFYRIVDKAIEWGDGRIVKLEIAYDNTEKRKHEKFFRYYEKKYETLKRLESLATLAGGIAHRFNNSLSVITGHLNLIELEYPENKGLKENTRAMQKSTENMTQLTSSLLAYARGGKYYTQTFLLIEFIKETLDYFKYKLPPMIKLISDFPVGDYTVKANKDQLQMVLFAILENSMESINNMF